MSGEPDQVMVLPQPTLLPLWTALTTGVFFLGLLFKLYWLAPIGAAATVALFCLWPRSLGSRQDRGPIDIGRNAAVPEDSEVADNATLWAARFAITADATLYASLLFGVLYLAIIAPGWDGAPLPVNWWPALALPAGIAASLLARLARGRNAAGASPLVGLTGAGLLSGLAALASIIGMLLLPGITSHANLALRFALYAYCAVHAGVAMLIALHAASRWMSGHVSASRATDIRLTVLWTDFATVALLPAGALLVLLGNAGAAT